MNQKHTWINLSQLSKEDRRESAFMHELLQNSEEARATHSSDPENPNMPSKRWGHTSVEALNRMFIIGGYQGKSRTTIISSLRYQGIGLEGAGRWFALGFDLILFTKREFANWIFVAFLMIKNNVILEAKFQKR